MNNDTNIAKLARANIAKLARLYMEEGLTKEQAASEMCENGVPFSVGVKVLHAMK